MANYYVYVYIDPRNFEEFYFGKGCGSRKDAHLSDLSDSEKTRRIAAIKAAGLEPIVRVIARGLDERDAFLIEKTLLWKLGRNLTNISSGHYSDLFRPHDTMHLLLPRFDFENGLYYYNVGEGQNRDWDDYRRFGFISAGQAERFRDAMYRLNCGDFIAAYLKGRGYVGIGRITQRARPIREVVIEGTPLLQLPLRCQGMSSHIESDEKCEYVCTVEWEASVAREDAKWQSHSNLFTSQLVTASLESQPETIDFLEREFRISSLRDFVV